MFSNKEFEQSVLDKLDALLTKIDDSHKSTDSRIAELEQSFSKLQKQVDSVVVAQEKLGEDKNSSIGRIQETADEFSRKLLAFENTKNRLEKTIHDTLAKQLEVIVQKITYELKTFDKVHSDVTDISSQIAQIKPELHKFSAVAKNIKDVDFTLHRHAKDLELGDNKKLQLERENEKLKLMIAKMKQRK